jgi:hypothetical protein
MPSGDPNCSSTAGSLAGPIELHFDLDEIDMVAFYRSSTEIDLPTRQVWDGARRQFRVSIVMAVVLTILLITGLATNAFGMRSVEGFPVLSLALAAGVVGAWWTVSRYRKALTPAALTVNVTELARTEEARYHLGPQTMSIGADGIHLRMPHHDVTQRWSGMAEIRETPDGVYLRRRDRHWYIIPKRVFGSADEASSMVARSRAWLDEAGHGDARRVWALLAERDVACPGCRYNLRGITARACPECGRELDASLLLAPTPGRPRA